MGFTLDSYLEIARYGSEGTTLLVRTESGWQFVIAIHSDLLNDGSRSDVLTQTLREEAAQQETWKVLLDAYNRHPEYFQAAGISSEQDIVDELSVGNLRVFLEFIQHSLNVSVGGGWQASYEIMVSDFEGTRSVDLLNQHVLSIVNEVYASRGLPEFNSPRELRALLLDPDGLVTVDRHFLDLKGYHLWEEFGLIRDDLTIEGNRNLTASLGSPEQINQSERSIQYYQARVAAPAETLQFDESSPWYDQLSEGQVLYITARSSGSVQDAQGNQIPYNSDFKPGQVYHVQIENGRGRLLPDFGRQNPFGYGHDDVYFDLTYFDPITHYEQVNATQEHSQVVEKMFVILRLDHPELLLVEDGVLIGRMPVILGSAGMDTPSGLFSVNRARISRHMPSQRGVGNVLYFLEGGYAIHASEWWNWGGNQNTSAIDKGGYGSAGCVNLPGGDWERIPYGDDDISISRFVYNWATRDLQYDPFNSEIDQAAVRSQDGPSVNVVVLDELKHLSRHFPELTNAVSLQYNSLLASGNWLLPAFNEAE